MKNKQRSCNIEKVCSVLFTIAFFLFFGGLFYQEYKNTQYEYEYTTAKIENVSVEQYKKVGYYFPTYENVYVLDISLENGEIVTLRSEFFDEYKSGDIVPIRKVYKVKNGERKFVNYNLLN